MKREIYNYLRNKYKAWGWVGQRAHDASGINAVFPLDFIVSCDYGSDTDEFFSGNVISLEKLTNERKNWSNEDLNYSLDGDTGKQFWTYLSELNSQAQAICYRSFPRLEKIEDRDNFLKIYSSSSKLKHRLDDKIRFREKLESLGANTIPGFVTELRRETYNDIKSALSSPFVIQFPYGSSGSHTFVITNKKEYDSLVKEYKEHRAIIMRFINGISVCINLIAIELAGKTRIITSFPSVQLIGIKSCSSSSTTFCGNDFSAMSDLDEAVISKVKDMSGKIGKWVASEGFQGMFGIDMIIKDDHVYPLEINPRFQNSTALFTELEIVNKRHPQLFLFHIASFLRQDRELLKMMEKLDSSALNDPVDGAQIIIHAPEWFNEVGETVKNGIYKFEDGLLVFKKKAIMLSDCDSIDDILITCGVPQKGKKVYPGAPLCKIQTLGKVFDCGKNRLITGTNDIIKQVYELLDLKKIEGYRDTRYSMLDSRFLMKKA